ncbi:MAG: hypothetical protein FWG47_06375 [Propionibacteriaceae bacterium]|nr:hypothetical protein [Propionibacteriaceae bacterium]
MIKKAPDSQEMMNLLKQETFPAELGAGSGFLSDSVRDFFDVEFRERKLARADVIRDAGISRTYGYQILDGTRLGGRDYYLSIAIAMKLDLRTTQRMLAITGSGGLHPLLKRDAAIIFAINHDYDNAKLWSFMHELKLEPLDTNVG